MSEQITQNKLAKILEENFSPEYIDIEDESYLHAGHIESNGNSHFAITMVANCFNDKTILERHQAVYKAIGLEAFKRGLHALRLNLKAPNEVDKYEESY